jgi:hypothetical protein
MTPIKQLRYGLERHRGWAADARRRIANLQRHAANSPEDLFDRALQHKFERQVKRHEASVVEYEEAIALLEGGADAT